MSENILIWNKEASHYYEAAPVGNGRLGAMMFGRMVRERVVLNESSMWSGSHQDADRPEAYKVLPRLRELILGGKFEEATKLYNDNFTCKGPGSAHAAGANVQFGCFQTLGDLNLYFFQAVSANNQQLPRGAGVGGGGQCEDVVEYVRRLDFTSGISSMRYKHRWGGIHERECFASRADDCVIMRISGAGDHGVSFNAQLSRPEKFRSEALGSDTILMTGQLENGIDGKGVKYTVIVRAGTEGGTISTEHNVLLVRGAKTATLYITMATDYRGFAGRQSTDARTAAEADMERVFGKDWGFLRDRAVEAHGALYGRSSLNIEGPKQSGIAIDCRLAALRKSGKDHGLYELLYNYSRYLLISSNRPDGLPANLQGLWGDEIQTGWNGDWHLDAQQMNFWGAEVTGLPELHQPYLNLIQSLTGPGGKTAKAYYNARGWVAHTITNPWGFTSPGENAGWGATTCGSAWLCQHIWDHYLFSPDEEYLKWAYPILKGCALFYLDMLILDPKTGFWVTVPANSPENSFITPDGQISALCTGPTVDNQLVRYVFSAVINAADLLGVDTELASDLVEKRKGLAPSKTAANGGVQEWIDDYPAYQPNHRHTSHLWGVYPGDEITPEDTPSLMKAVKRTIVMRGKASPGWANMHRAGIFARICDGDAAKELLDFHLCTGSYLNLFCRTYHATEKERLSSMPEPDNYSYPFQIDANLAISGVVAEFFIQSHRYSLPPNGSFAGRVYYIKLLPALPSDWESGSVTGLRARGGFTLDIEWRFHMLSGVTLKSTGGIVADIGFQNRMARITVPKNGSVKLNGNLEMVQE
jgi:alpha-L-fucosidase 2